MSEQLTSICFTCVHNGASMCSECMAGVERGNKLMTNCNLHTLKKEPTIEQMVGMVTHFYGLLVEGNPDSNWDAESEQIYQSILRRLTMIEKKPTRKLVYDKQRKTIVTHPDMEPSGLNITDDEADMCAEKPKVSRKKADIARLILDIEFIDTMEDAENHVIKWLKSKFGIEVSDE